MDDQRRSGSADQPLTFEDKNFGFVKEGRRKRLLGMNRALQKIWTVELSIYDGVVQRARALRRCRSDLVEIFAGHGHVSQRALERGLRVLQPVDRVFGLELNRVNDFTWLRRTLDWHKPVLTVLEPECKLWSPLTNLNYYWRPDELELLRQEAQVTVRGVANTIRDIIHDDRYFLLENPRNGVFWKQEPIARLQSDFQLYYDYDNMCAYDLRGKDNGLICKPTGWLSSSPTILASVCKKCKCQTTHETCVGGNSQRAAVYTWSLAKSLVHGLEELLQELGDLETSATCLALHPGPRPLQAIAYLGHQ